MEHFHKLEEMLLQFAAKAAISIEKVVYAADSAGLKAGIPDAGTATFSQIAGSDCAYIRLEGHGKKGRGMADFKEDDWVVVKGTPGITEDGSSITLTAQSVEACGKPEEEYVYPYF